MKNKVFKTTIPGREEVTLQLSQNTISLHVIGGPKLLRLANKWRKFLKDTSSLNQVPMPEGQSTEELLLKITLLKARGQWNPPLNDEELCHCRGIPTETVVAAILTGAHTPQEVSAKTSASTACGTCRPDVEDLIKYIL